MEKCAKNLKRLVLELGGKDPMVVFADADLDKAAEDAVANSVFNAGQVCCAVERIYIEQSVKAEFEQKVVELAKKHKVGDGSENGVTMGPMVSQMQLEIVKQHVEDSIAHGATKLYESDVPAGGGNWCPITVLTDLNQDMLIQRAETFGPVVALSTFDGTEGEAIKLANDTEYGLASYVYTQDLMKASRVARKIKAGQVGINCYSLVAAQPKCPWCVDTSGVGPKFALLFISHIYLFSFGTPTYYSFLTYTFSRLELPLSSNKGWSQRIWNWLAFGHGWLSFFLSAQVTCLHNYCTLIVVLHSVKFSSNFVARIVIFTFHNRGCYSCSLFVGLN
jgi:hypothetical protein